MTLRIKQKKALVFLLVRIVLSWTTDIFLSGCPGDQSHTFVVNVVRPREHTFFFVCLISVQMYCPELRLNGILILGPGNGNIYITGK